MSSPAQHEFWQRKLAADWSTGGVPLEAVSAVAAWHSQMDSAGEMDELRRLEEEEKLLASEVRSLRGEVEEMAAESMNAEVKVQQEEGRVSTMEVRLYKKAEETLQLLKDGNDHCWHNIRSWIGWEDCGWEPNYY
jgi:tellurite resistance protein